MQRARAQDLEGRIGRGLRRYRIEQREQDQPGEETADVGLPGDGLLDPRKARRVRSEQEVEPNHATRKMTMRESRSATRSGAAGTR